MAICPKCGREYNCPPAISRENNETEICPVCGMLEAIEPLPLSNEEKERMIAEAEQAEIERGRVKPLSSFSSLTSSTLTADVADVTE